MKSQRNVVITEAKLRKLIRNEIARQRLVQEGFIDSIKKPFASLSNAVKEEISKKTEEIIQKLNATAESLKSGPMDEVQKFLKSLESQEQGGSAEELIGKIPELQKIASFAKELKELDPQSLIAADVSQKSEGITRAELATQFVLLDERTNYMLESYDESSDSLLKEIAISAAIGTAFAGWWAFEKAVVGGLGLAYWGLKFLSWACNKLGLPNAAKYLKEQSEKAHHLEDAIIELTVFPAPIQYAAYSAASFLHGDSPMSYEEFVSPSHKETRAEVYKILKFALLVPMIVDALSGLISSLSSSLSSFGDLGKAVKYAAKTASETGAAAKVIST